MHHLAYSHDVLGEQITSDLSDRRKQRREHRYRCSRLLLALFYLVPFLLCFPLGKLPLSFLTLEKGLYLWEQDTGQCVYLMDGYSRAVVVDFPFSRQ